MCEEVRHPNSNAYMYNSLFTRIANNEHYLLC